jgi:5-methylcytosine-specific restriction protein A
MTTEETLKTIKPTQSIDVIDIVNAAGIGVEQWAVKKDGSAAMNARANPAYVYEWAFGGDLEPSLLCVWHDSLSIVGNQITMSDCVRDYALRLDRIATEPKEPPKVKTRARGQARRARKFDGIVQRAYRKGLPVRVVLLEGQKKEDGELGWATSEVDKRLLDTENWYVHSYREDDGAFRLVRSIQPQVDDTVEVTDDAPYYDALDDIVAPPLGNVSPEKRTFLTSGFERDDAVREAVRVRSKGFCEYCNTAGFELADGRRYIETHHLIWLSEGGPDTVSNVIALCANHHREVHFGSGRKALEEKMLQKLKLLAPSF